MLILGIVSGIHALILLLMQSHLNRCPRLAKRIKVTELTTSDKEERRISFHCSR